MDNWKDYVEGVKGKNGRWGMKMDWKNKEEIKEYKKEYRKNLYIEAIKRICEYYNLKKPICFVDKKEIPIRMNILKNEFLVIDHKIERETGLKDKYISIKLYMHIISCPKEELNNYQLLCSNHNIIKNYFYLLYSELKKKKNSYTKEANDIYNKLFLYDKEKLKKELIKERKEYLIKDDKNDKH